MQLASNQWLHSEQEVSFFAQVSQVGSTPTPDAQATVRATIQEWANGVGESCTSVTATPAQFASSANEAAWHAAGLLDSPNEQPVTGCTTVGGATGTNGLGLAEGTGVTDARAYRPTLRPWPTSWRRGPRESRGSIRFRPAIRMRDFSGLQPS